MSGTIHRLPNPRWASVRTIAVTTAAVLLLPFVLLALVPMLLMFVPVAVVGIPLIAPVMLSGALAARWEGRRRALPAADSGAMKRPTLVAR